MNIKNRGLVVWLSVVAGLQALAASSGLAGVFSDRALGLIVALVAALNAGTAAYLAGIGHEVAREVRAGAEVESG